MYRSKGSEKAVLGQSKDEARVFATHQGRGNGGCNICGEFGTVHFQMHGTILFRYCSAVPWRRLCVLCGHSRRHYWRQQCRAGALLAWAGSSCWAPGGWKHWRDRSPLRRSTESARPCAAYPVSLPEKLATVPSNWGLPPMQVQLRVPVSAGKQDR
jgi:hypothetical protein